MLDTVIIRDYFYRDRAGNQRMQRWIGNQCIFDEGSKVVFVDWWNLKSAWTTMVRRPTDLVKEGPKEMVVYERNV